MSAPSATPSASSPGPEALYTLRHFGIDPVEHSVASLLRERGSFELLAWYGDALLERFITDLLWKVATSKAAAPPSLQLLHDRRVRYTSNATLACFMRHATDIQHPTSCSDHALGTLFEGLLALLHREQGEDAALNMVNLYRRWVKQHPDLVAAAHPRPHSVTLTLSWSDAAPSAWQLRQCNRAWAGFEGSPFVINGDSIIGNAQQQISGLIAKTQEEAVAHKQWALTQEQERLSREQQEQQNHIQAAVEANPHRTDIRVPRRRTVKFLPDGDLVIQELPPSDHSGDIVQVVWWSRKKNRYLESFGSCCGMRGAEQECNKANWREPTRVHPGRMEIPRGTNKYKMGGGVGSVCVGRFPNWSCCHALSTEPGCQSQKETIGSSFC